MRMAFLCLVYRLKHDRNGFIHTDTTDKSYTYCRSLENKEKFVGYEIGLRKWTGAELGQITQSSCQRYVLFIYKYQLMMSGW